MTAIALKLNTAVTVRTAARRTGLCRRSLSQRLELAGVLTLMASSAAYALVTLSHLV